MYNMHTHKEFEKAVIRSQHTQRNWNLSKNIPKDDVNVMLHAVTNCPSKQNIAFYKVHFIQDRDVIEEIHEQTEGFSTKRKKGDPVGFETNPQTLANLLVLFENYDFTEDLSGDVHRNAATLSFIKTGKLSNEDHKEKDVTSISNPTPIILDTQSNGSDTAWASDGSTKDTGENVNDIQDTIDLCDEINIDDL